MRIGFGIVFCLLAMTGCVEWPDVETPLPSRGTAGWPELQPTTTLSTPAVSGDEEERASALLQARAAALRRRAALMRTPVSDQTDFDRLRALLGR